MPTPLTITFTPGYTWVVGEVVTEAKLNLTANPTISLSGTISTSSIGDGSITTAKYQDASVTAAKLAGTLDLSGKTLTLPAASVTYANLETDFLIDATTATIAPGDFIVFADISDSNIVKKTTLANALANIQFTSAEFSIADGVIAATPHGLASRPSYVRWVLVAQASADTSFTTGDEVDVACFMMQDAQMPMFTYGADATNVFITKSNAAGDEQVGRKDTGAPLDWDATKWKAKCYARV